MPKKPETLKACPKCGSEYVWFDMTKFSVFYYGANTLITFQTKRRIPMTCINSGCSQKYFWYPRTGRITSRTNVRGTVKKKKK